MAVGDFHLLSSLDNLAEPVGHYIDNQVELNVTYYYNLRAENISGDLSIASDSISYCLLEPVSKSTMQPNGLTQLLQPDRKITWQYPPNISMEEYTITIIDMDDLLTVRLSFTPQNYTGYQESWIIPASVNLISGRLYKWRVDMGASFTGLIETKGSESFWATFVYHEG